MTSQKTILLSFDVEEFDLPCEYGIAISKEEQMQVGMEGTLAMQKILKQMDVKATLFTTAIFAETWPSMMQQLATKHEVASHSYYHTDFKNEDLLLSRQKLEEICGTKVHGFRMPRFKKIDLSLVRKAGYEYDSSINPTYMPGRYDNRHLPQIKYKENGLWRVPLSVTPHLRIPLFWMAFKNFPLAFYKYLALNTLKKHGYLSLYFHPWEFTELEKYKIPFYLKTSAGNALSQKLTNFIDSLKKEAAFKTIHSFLNEERN
jgi:peptidoglycan/xylan/chitin deacetylase (PgdA/CDA1 family)